MLWSPASWRDLLHPFISSVRDWPTHVAIHTSIVPHCLILNTVINETHGSIKLPSAPPKWWIFAYLSMSVIFWFTLSTLFSLSLFLSVLYFTKPYFEPQYRNKVIILAGPLTYNRGWGGVICNNQDTMLKKKRPHKIHFHLEMPIIFCPPYSTNNQHFRNCKAVQ